ncbi:acylphosphatase [archaeon]|nr:acylphosphatase [archaeon]
MALKRVHIILKGKVTGVFFREFAKQEANRRGIVGYAKNIKDEVEIVAQGEAMKIEDFIKQCKKGPMNAFVQSSEIKEEPVDEAEFEYFDIRHL